MQIVKDPPCAAATALPASHVQVSKAAQALSMEINSKRQRRGLKARAVRAVVIGFPNVGKSALINRFLGKRLCDSAPKPGVTKHLRWLRIGADLDMLDAPGVAALPVLGLCAVLGSDIRGSWSAWMEMPQEGVSAGGVRCAKSGSYARSEVCCLAAVRSPGIACWAMLAEMHTCLTCPSLERPK